MAVADTQIAAAGSPRKYPNVRIEVRQSWLTLGSPELLAYARGANVWVK